MNTTIKPQGNEDKENRYETFLCKQCELAKIKEWDAEDSKNEEKSWRNSIRVVNANNRDIAIRIPEFQRGLVWKASQIETLWDSVMRGIPIGCITLIRYTGKKYGQLDEYGVFDGQQRLYALSLCHENPFDASKNNVPILWLDLSPDDSDKKARKYCFYLTTPGQPWGYKIADSGVETNQEKLSSSACRIAIDNARKYSMHEEDDKHISKPFTREMWPFYAKCPVPFAIIWDAAQDTDSHESLKQNIKEKIRQSEQNGQPWCKNITSEERNIIDNIDEKFWKELYIDIQNAIKSEIIVVISPQSFNNRKESIQDNNDDNSDVAAFFSRLNRGGSEPSPEDVNYSILKSMLPALDSIDTLAENRMKPSRLATIAMRLYLTEHENRWKANISHKDVYKLATDRDFEDFVRLRGKLRERIIALENLLLWNAKERRKGMPAYILSSVVHSNQDLYMFFLSLMRFTPQDKDAYLSAFMLLALFGNNIVYADAYVQKKMGMKHLLYYLAMRNQLLIPPAPDIYQRIHEVTQKKQFEALDEAWNPNLFKYALERIWNWRKPEAKMLLLYACRNYIWETFREYDPAHAVWAEENCLWDYDHIFPQNWLIHGQGKPQGPYHGEVNEFIHCIGNIAPIPFSRNRQKHDSPPYDPDYKYLGKEDSDLFAELNDEDPKPAFLVQTPGPDNKIENNRDTMLELGCIVARRMERIYRNCYDSLNWKDMLDFKNEDCARRDLFELFRMVMIENGFPCGKVQVWAITHKGTQIAGMESSLYGRNRLACGIPIEYVDMNGLQCKGLACICSDGIKVEWGIRRHPDDTSVGGNLGKWWLFNSSNLQGWGSELCRNSQDIHNADAVVIAKEVIALYKDLRANQS